MNGHIIFTLGSLEVYAEQPPVAFGSGIYVNQVFWRDAGSPQGYGPFNSLYEAMSHYAYVSKSFKDVKTKGGATEDKVADVIRVDFIHRKRL